MAAGAGNGGDAVVEFAAVELVEVAGTAITVLRLAAGAAGDSTILFCSSQKDAKETGGYDRADVLLEYSCCH